MSIQEIDPWDKPVSPPPERLSPERVKHLHADIYAYDWDDRDAVPQVLGRLLEYVEAKALTGDEGAIQTLEVCAVRATSGIPFGEPQEPAWALDPEPPNYTKNRGE